MLRFQPFAVETDDGPHVTMQAGVVHAGRYWTSSSRASRKVRQVRRLRHASVLLTDGATTTVAAGAATVLDPLHPLDAAADPTALAASGPALVRLGLTYPEEVAGYVRSIGRVPTEWWPVARVLVVVQLEDRVDSVDGEVVAAVGAFDRLVPRPRTSRWAPHRRPKLGELPSPAIELATAGGPCAVGLMTPSGAVVIPGAWSYDDGIVAVAEPVLRQLAPQLPGPCCVTLDRSDDRHPDRKSGVMLRGRCAPIARDGATATLAVRIERTTHWDGFATSTVAA